jgi:hypothetical protein
MGRRERPKFVTWLLVVLVVMLGAALGFTYSWQWTIPQFFMLQWLAEDNPWLYQSYIHMVLLADIKTGFQGWLRYLLMPLCMVCFAVFALAFLVWFNRMEIKSKLLKKISLISLGLSFSLMLPLFVPILPLITYADSKWIQDKSSIEEIEASVIKDVSSCKDVVTRTGALEQVSVADKQIVPFIFKEHTFLDTYYRLKMESEHRDSELIFAIRCLKDDQEDCRLSRKIILRLANNDSEKRISCPIEMASRIFQ